MATYPTSLPPPDVSGLSISEKLPKDSISFLSGRNRDRKKTFGFLHTCNATFKFCDKLQSDTFEEFVRYDISYGDLWFNADWFEELGFTPGSYSFKFDSSMNIKTSGYTTEYSVRMLISPLVPEEMDLWAKSEGDQPFQCVPTLEADIDPVTLPFQFGYTAGSGFRSKVTFRSNWYAVGNHVQEASNAAIAPFFGAPPPNIGCFGIAPPFVYYPLPNPAEPPGLLAGAECPDPTKGYTQSFGEFQFGTEPSTIDQEYGQIDACNVEYCFTGARMIGNTAGPVTNAWVHFLNAQKRLLYEHVVGEYAVNDDEQWDLFEINGTIPATTRFIRIYLDFQKNNGSITWLYAFYKNCMFAIRSKL